jgi:hypothetical protein
MRRPIDAAGRGGEISIAGPAVLEGVMILGMSIEVFTVLHVIISLIGIVSGLVVVAGMFKSERRGGWTALFLASTVLTSASGFLFPATALTPAQIFGYVSLLVLAVTLLGLYVFRLAGAWRWIYVAGAVLALYLNAFVFIVQAFQKVPFLNQLAPNGSEPPFLALQGVLLAAFVVLGLYAVRRFHPELRA